MTFTVIDTTFFVRDTYIALNKSFDFGNMKRILFVLLLMSGVFAAAQQSEVHYKFTLAGVVDLPTAKEIKDPLRAKFQCYTVYNEATQQFDFISAVQINQDQLQEYLNEYGYVITAFQALPVTAVGGAETE